MLPLEIVPNNLSEIEKEERARSLLHLVGLEGFEGKNHQNFLVVCVKELHYVEH